jgi:hypothetical protein
VESIGVTFERTVNRGPRTLIYIHPVAGIKAAGAAAPVAGICSAGNEHPVLGILKSIIGIGNSGVASIQKYPVPSGFANHVVGHGA